MRATGIIINGSQILLIHRYFKNEDYFVLPGGRVEKNETIEQALIRELKEETGFDVIINKKLWEHKNKFDMRVYYYFLVTEFGGKLCLGGPEAVRNSKVNKYTLEWHEITNLKNLNLHDSPIIKDKIIKQFT